ncbi:MAG TPA: 1,4-dihydroxy-2-naphthoate polyprenyltransferase [Acidimicrobiales bacterium]|nr:1,4-dihydroxy-2-naphthoate polyprenyltransferase [Acidimicrobiales bacterium]
MTAPQIGSARAWIEGARPRTLPAAAVPVMVGTAVAERQGDIIWWRAGAAMLVAVAIQVATNYANDYSDGVRGTDDDRVGPLRLVASGLKPPAAVKRAAVLSFGAAAAAGLVLALAAAWWLVLVGAACILAGWFYTGGSRPYGYAGLGEVAVFVFFGVVATVGSAFVHLEKATLLALGCAIPVGSLATALLIVNNLRDIPTDTAAGKRTLAVRMGDDDTRLLYVVAVAVVPAVSAAILVVGVSAWFLLLAAAAPFAVAVSRPVLHGARGRDLVPVLAGTGRAQLAYGLLLVTALVVS